MSITPRHAAQITATLLIAVVVTQIVYFTLSSVGADINRMIIWTAEAAAFLGISAFALAAMAHSRRHAAMWAAIAVGGMLNVIQIGMGLTMFVPLSDAGETMAPAFSAVLAGAFFLYFAAKFLFGGAAIAVGLTLMRSAGGAGKAIGVLAGLTGLAAMAANLYAMATGMDAVFPAGAAGTAATAFLALAIIATNRAGSGGRDRTVSG